mgnify:CR=1 FL=1
MPADDDKLATALHNNDQTAIGASLGILAAFAVLVTLVAARLFRDRTDVPVGPSRGDDHVVGKCRFAAKVDGDRFFRLHVVEAGEDHIQRLVGVGLRLQGRSFRRCFTRGLGRLDSSLAGSLG